MLRRGTLALACFVTTVSCYETTFIDCNIRCTQETGCPDGMSCDENFNLCVSDSGEPCVGVEPRFTQITTGFQHACAIDNGGRLFCWGSDERGQVTGTIGPAVQVMRQVGIPGVSWIAVDAGGNHTCAIGTSNGTNTLYCWGDNNQEQCGVDGVGSVPVTPVAGVDNPREVALGAAHTCVVTTSDQMFCWGANDKGQLGTTENLTGTSETPTLVPGEWVLVRSSNRTTCALHVDGSIQCFGRNNAGQFGNDSIAMADDPEPTPQAVDGVTSPHALAVGRDSICTVGNDSLLRCWGANGNGEAGVRVSANTLVPQLVEGTGSEPTWIDVKVGTGFGCGLTVDGVIQCWGNEANEDSPLGDGCTGCRAGVNGPRDDLPVVVEVGQPSPGAAFALDLGEAFGCALFGDPAGGVIQCWGANDHGQLGNSRITRIPKASRLAEDGPWVTVRLGQNHGCAIRDDQTVWCWGSNQFEQVHPTLPDLFRASPFQIPGISDAIDLALGNSHTCALVGDVQSPSVTCWGDNSNFELGNMDVLVKTGIPQVSVRAWTAIHASANLTCVSLADTNVECWGQAAWFGVQTLPLAVNPGNISGFQLRLGPDSGCTFAGGAAQIRCFGINTDGERGDGSGPGVGNFPMTTVREARLVSDMDSTAKHRCAYDPGSGTYCWGNNESHQAGNPSTTDITTAALIAGPSLMVKAPIDFEGERTIVAGGLFSCAIEQAGQVHCWGGNGFQECTEAGFNNQGTHRPITVEPPNLAFRTLAAGSFTACAITDDVAGDLYCWGLSDHGQAGTGDSSKDFLVQTIPAMIAP